MKAFKRGLWILALVTGFLVAANVTTSFAEVTIDVDAIEAEIATAVATGADPVIAAKGVVANAVRAIVAANPNYPGGLEALQRDILAALAEITITGLDDTDLFVSANYAFGNTQDAALEAYEAPGAQGRANARNRGGNAYGPGGKPQAGSPT